MDAVSNPEVRLQRAGNRQMSVIKEEVLPERQDCSSSLHQEDPEPPHIKEEQEDPEPKSIKEELEDPEPKSIKEELEELGISQEGEPLQELEEEAGNKFSFTPVKRRDDEEEARFSNSTKTARRKATNKALENTRATTHFWTEEQTEFMLNVLKELNILKFMDGRKTRNGDLFKKVALKMLAAGFPRTPEQIRIRWKNLKKAFFQAKREPGASGRGRSTCPSFDVLDDLLGGGPLSLVEHNGVDSGVQLPTTMDATMDETLLGGSPGSSSPRSTTQPSSTPLRPAITDDLPEWREDMARSEAREERLIATILRTDSMDQPIIDGVPSAAAPPQPDKLRLTPLELHPLPLLGYLQGGQAVYLLPPPAAVPRAAVPTAPAPKPTAPAPKPTAPAPKPTAPATVTIKKRKRFEQQQRVGPYVKKPPNAFMMFMKEQRPNYAAQMRGGAAVVNGLLGQKWKSLSEDEQAKYYRQADVQKRLHAQCHPDWTPGNNYGVKRKRDRSRAAGLSAKRPNGKTMSPMVTARLHVEAGDIQQPFVIEEVLPERQDSSIKEDQQDPEPPHIKEEQEDPEPPHIKEDQQDPEPPHIKEEQQDPEPKSIKDEQEDPVPPHIKEEEDPVPPHIKEEQEDLETPRIKEEKEEPEPQHIKEEQEDLEPPHIKEEQEDLEPPRIKEEKEDPEPPHIKEEPEDLGISQEREQLEELEEAGNKFSFTPVKSRDDEEEAQFSKSPKADYREAEHLKTEPDGEEVGSRSDPDSPLQPTAEDTSHSSECEPGSIDNSEMKLHINLNSLASRDASWLGGRPPAWGAGLLPGGPASWLGGRPPGSVAC
ncbi:Transcription factor 7-like 1 [Liparis tanakae]|uniref:Transcription factor 7-like 1 n=1 Tax=Liparis tanakae TaxID=230148 RepID=A0A4Z2F854_9TELE|nr:Transcription factor 7-like 1 [Liparis tanakae]